MKIVIDIPKKTIERIRSDYGHGYRGFCDEDRAILFDAVYSSTTPKNKVLGIIPCEDCKHYRPFFSHPHIYGCHIRPIVEQREPNDFCSRAERREEE